jgi:hypothetical protein
MVDDADGGLRALAQRLDQLPQRRDLLIPVALLQALADQHRDQRALIQQADPGLDQQVLRQRPGAEQGEQRQDEDDEV